MPLRLVLVASLAVCACKRDEAVVRVAAASDLADAFEELGRAFEKETGKKVVFDFGSTGQLAKQIHEGAPFDAFAAASVESVDGLIASADCDGATKRVYARGQLAIFTRPGLAPATSLEALADPQFKRLAIANPGHAPYGRAAKEALTAAGVWDAVQPRLVLGDNVRQALQFARTGNADAAIIAYSLVIQEPAGVTKVDPSKHRPLDQALAACRHGSSEAGGRAFVTFVTSPSSREVLDRHGLTLPKYEDPR